MCSTSFVGSRDHQKSIWMDTQGCQTHIVEIFKFGDVSGPQGYQMAKGKGVRQVLGEKDGTRMKG